MPLAFAEWCCAAEDGATYHAVDTGEMWVFYNSMWMLDLHPARFIHSPLMLP